MGHYKTRYHKKNGDRLSSYIFLGISIIVFIFAVSFLLYNSLKTDITYSDYTHIDSFNEVLDQNVSKYYIYYYSENYLECQEIKDLIFDFAENNPANIPVYFVDASSVSGVNMIGGLDTIPSLLLVDNSLVVNIASSASDITSVIESYE